MKNLTEKGKKKRDQNIREQRATELLKWSCMWTSHIATITTKWEKTACRLPNSWTIPCSALRMYIYVPCIYSQGCIFGGVYVLAFTLKDVYFVEFLCICIYSQGCIFCGVYAPCIYSQGRAFGGVYAPCIYSPGCTWCGVCVPFKIYSHSRCESLQTIQVPVAVFTQCLLSAN